MTNGAVENTMMTSGTAPAATTEDVSVGYVYSSSAGRDKQVVFLPTGAIHVASYAE